MQIIYEPQLDFSDVLIKPKRSELTSRSDVSLTRKFRGRWNKSLEFSANPIVLANMDNITTWEMTDKLLNNGCMVAMNKFVNMGSWIGAVTQYSQQLSSCALGYSIGIRKDSNGVYIELDQFRKLKELFPNVFKHLMIDVPNGYMESFADFVAMVRNEFPELFITVGNVVSAEMVQELILKGADCVKVGIGSGNVCKTRLKAGVGRPQLSSIIECADAAHGLGGYIMSDGGCKLAGDVAKAFCAGSDFCMLGSMFAGHEECDGDVIEKYALTSYDAYYYKNDYSMFDSLSAIGPPILCTNQPERDYSLQTGYNKIYEKQKFKEFWGMSSKRAMEKNYGKMEDYRSSEGREVLVPYKGEVQNTINDILGGLRSMCTYIGAKSLKDAPKCATFYLVNNQVSNMFND